MNLKDLPLFSQVRTSAPLASSNAHPFQAQMEEPVQSELSGTQASKPWSISELTRRVRGVIEPAFTQIWVIGEISNYRPATSGHAYFSLKDEGAMISAAVFGWSAKRAKSPRYAFDLQDGMQVLCRGKLTLYPPRGTYQLAIDHIEPQGAGALQVAFEQLKNRLAKEGLFDKSRKRPLPRFPQTIAVVTSPSGAAIRDMLNILARRAPHVRVLIIPAIVQGDDAPAQIIRGVEFANRFCLGDVLVLARGGGSIEDLWCFNDENLARAIARSNIPTVSAVGHEIDFTISDFVSDLRAPTPSAAAELITSHWLEASQRIADSKDRMKSSLTRWLSQKKALLVHISARVISPKDRLREQAQRCDELALRMNRAIQVRTERARANLLQFSSKLDALSPLRVLERGYTIIREADTDFEKGRDGLIRSAHQVKSGQKLQITFHDGDKKVFAE